MYDTIIVGNGIAGMSAAIYAKRANLDFKIVGEEEFSVGQIENAILVENYPGIKAVSGYDLGNSMKEQMEEMDIFVEEKRVTGIEIYTDKMSNYFVVKYSDNSEDTARTVIYTLGAKHRKLSEICEIEDDVIYHHCAICDGALYKGKDIVIIGGGNTAFTEALYLSKIANRVIIITDKIIADTITVKRVQNTENIDILNETYTKKIWKENDKYVLNCTHLNSDFELHTEGIFAAIGTKPQSQYCPDEIKKDVCGYILANECGETNIEGFYAGGDIRRKILRQAITAAADGANCANSVVEYLKHN